MGQATSTNSTADSPTGVTTPPAAIKRFDGRRVYTAALLVPAIYAIIRYLPPWALTLLVIAGGSIALIELYRMSFQGRSNPLLIGIGLITSALIVARIHTPFTLIDLIVVTMLALLMAMLFSSTPMEHRLRDTAITFLGVFYVGLTLSMLVSIRSLPSGELFVLFIALVTWTADAGAYYAGILWGSHLLAPSVSPKKTVEGVLGGMALATGIALLAQAWFLPQLSLWDAAVLGVLLTGAGLFGDLCESAIKRSVGVKDSGGILPGHGGMLDRLDSLLFTAPACYYYITLVRGISPLP